MKPFNKYLLAASGAILSPVAALADQTGGFLGTTGYDHMGYGMGAGGWFFGPLMMLAVFALLVGAVVLILRQFGYRPASDTQRPVMDLLNERFARGEIDRAEYEERRNALSL